MIDFKVHAEEVFPREACAFVAGGRVVPVENISDSPRDTFRVRPEEMLRVERQYGPVEVFLHSHPGGPAYPTAADMRSQVDSGVPWGICPVYDGKASEIFYWGGPLSERAPLLDRPFRHGVTDCYGLIRDWYALELSIDLPEVPRDWEWWPSSREKPVKGRDLYRENFEAAGFRSLGRIPPVTGDLLLMSIRSSVPNHGALYLGDTVVDGVKHRDQILHHPAGRFGFDPSRRPRREPLARWTPHVTHVLRWGH